MAMLIAWQTVNAVRHSNSKHFTRGFLICAPGLTIKDRLRVLQPNDPDSYYANRELVPSDMLDDINRAKIVITNYHAFKLRERMELSAGGRALLQGRTGDAPDALETEGQMIQRVMPDLMGMKNVLAINDEAHHCYREKPAEPDDEELKGDDRKQAEKDNEAARLWISGLEAVNRKLGLSRMIDLSATPFFLRGASANSTIGTKIPSRSVRRNWPLRCWMSGLRQICPHIFLKRIGRVLRHRVTPSLNIRIFYHLHCGMCLKPSVRK